MWIANSVVKVILIKVSVFRIYSYSAKCFVFLMVYFNMYVSVFPKNTYLLNVLKVITN